MLKILAQILEQARDFDLVGSATDAYQALRHMAALSPQLVLMDIHFPGLSGIHAARYMKESEHPPMVILISSDDSSVTRSLAEQAGADGCVSKRENFRGRMIRSLQNLFGARYARDGSRRNISSLHQEKPGSCI
jgi:DNA-binding NarL/FixJ family response regulator